MLLYLSVRKKSKTKKPKKRFHVCGPCFSTSPCLLQKIIAAKIYRSLLGANIKSIQMMAGHQISRLNAGLDIGSKKPTRLRCHTFPFFLASLVLIFISSSSARWDRSQNMSCLQTISLSSSDLLPLKFIDLFLGQTSSLCGRRRGTKSQGWMQDWTLEAKKTNKAAVSYLPIFLCVLGSYLHFFFER